MVEPAGTPSSDVLELLCEVSPKQFMTAFQESEWATAYFLCNKSTLHSVLALEPHNPTILEFKRLLPLKLKQGGIHTDMQEEAAAEAEEEEGSGSESAEESGSDEEESEEGSEQGSSESVSEGSSESSEESTESTQSETVRSVFEELGVSARRPPGPIRRPLRQWRHVG